MFLNFQEEMNDMNTDTLQLYRLSMHETLQLKCGIHVMRVPSGWIYDCWNEETDSFKPGVFVPFAQINFSQLKMN